MFPNVKLTSSSSPKFPKYCKIWSHYEQHVCIENSKRENISVDVCRNIETDFSWYKFIFTQSWMVALDISVKGGQTGLKNSLNLCLNFYSFSIWLSLQWDKIQRNFATLSNFKSLGNFLISQYLVNFCTYFGILFLLGKLSLLQIAKDWKIIQQSGNTVSLLSIF